MKRLAILAAALLCTATLAWAGPNAGGTLVAHDANLQYTSDSVDYCGLGTPPSSCESVDPNVEGSSGSNPRVWKVYAAFPESAQPRLKGMTYGINYDAGNLVLVAWGPCIGDPNNGAAEFPGAGWPEPNTGTSIVWQFVQTDHLVEAYWFAGYSYYGNPSIFTLQDHPDPVLGGNFADDSVPAQQDSITCYGTIGFDIDGAPCCPQGEQQGACCIGEECTITTQANCAGEWLGPGTLCDPNPCLQPVEGACCFGTDCLLMNQTDCLNLGGVYQGDNTTCDPNPCLGPPTGACCFDDSCAVLTEEECLGQDGRYMGDNSTCDPNPCLPPGTGACCIGDSCAVLTQAECQGAGGEYQGDGTSCDPNPCLPPQGACCVGEECRILSQEDCLAQGGVYQGDGTVCEPNPCIPPVQGACCFDQECQVLTQSDCEGQGGLYQGDNTSCEPNPCLPPPTGACCIGDSCAVLTQVECETQQGEYQGDNTSCEPNPCEGLATGACCFGGTCEVLTQSDCEGQGGVYQGDDTTCEPNPCEGPLMGACCIGDSCQVLTQSDCEGQGGTYQGDNTSCEPNPCLLATGACCYGEECLVQTESECLAQGGVFQGENTTCDPNPCLAPVTGACCIGDSCQVLTQSDCEAQEGEYQGDNTTCDPNPCVGVPVLFGPVSVELRDYGVDLTWSYISDLGVTEFLVLRSMDTYSEPGVLANLEPTSDSQQAYRDEKVRAGETYYYYIEAVDLAGDTYRTGPWTIEVTGPTGPILMANQPNPTTNATAIRFYLPDRSDVRLEIYDPRGRLVRQLTSPGLGTGTHHLLWDGKDQQGHAVPGGVYQYKLVVSGTVLSGKVTMIR